jgi:protein involved in polysaccharide export with SLBB domain
VTQRKGKDVNLRVLTVLAMMVAAIVGAGTVYAQSADAPVAAYELGPGDEVRVTVFGHDDLSGVFVLGGDGTVSLPLIGQIGARQKSVRQLEGLIVDALKPDYLKNPSVNVQVLNYRPFYILGEVKSPGSYAYVSGMKVINAVALGGGYTYRAKENKVYIDRSGDESQRIVGAPETPVLPGDIIHVPERFF